MRLDFYLLIPWSHTWHCLGPRRVCESQDLLIYPGFGRDIRIYLKADDQSRIVVILNGNPTLNFRALGESLPASKQPIELFDPSAPPR